MTESTALIVEPLRHLAVPLPDLHEDPANARKHPDVNLDAIKASLVRFGQRKPIVVRRAGMVVEAGNGTLAAARALGWSHLAAVIVDDDATTATGFAIADNRTAELAEWDEEVLAALMSSLQVDGFDIDDLGFDEDALRDLLATESTPASEVVEDAPPAPPAEAFTQPGDLWVLGNHRLLCGDCTSAEDVTRLMAGERAVLFATDPPYLVGYDDQEWDDADAERNDDLWLRFCRTARELAIREDAAWYCWYASVHHAKLQAVWEQVGAFVHQQIIWAKPSGVLTYSWYTWQHEPCLMGWVRPHKPRRNKDTKMRGTVWSLERVRDLEDGDHPTPKPVQAFAIPMEQHTRPGDVCYEPFSGSGTQIIAAEQLGRRCFAMELEPRYVDVAVRRWCQLTGVEAVRESDGAVFPMGEVL
ncbi:MAG: DNA methylase [Deltaproteobacteria bacterium]|nr:MAG: DNA methylase [Deltaproteobacteria bacterium]